MKSLGNENYIVRPYKIYKNQSYSYTYYSGSDPSGSVNIDEATIPETEWYWSGSSVEPQNTDGVYKKALYSSILNMFYPSGSVSMSHIENNLSRLCIPTNSLFVVNITQQSFGEGIKPTSFILTTGSSVIVDDGLGRLHYSGSTTIIGNIFYGLGIASINKSNIVGSSTALYLTTGSQVRIQFQSGITIYEHQAICTIEAGEFNWSSNPTILYPSSSISGSNKIVDYFSSGTLTPYMTTIGLYSSVNELIAIAKVPRVIKRTPNMAQTFIVRWDI